MTNSTLHNSSKINNLLKVWPSNGFVATQAWLGEHGISRQLADSYCKHQWLERISRGAYVRSGEAPCLYDAIHALRLLGFKIHIAANAALEWHGVRHYVTVGQMHAEAEWVFVDQSETKNIPKWFYDCFVKSNLAKLKQTNLFNKWSIGLVSSDYEIGLQWQKLTGYNDYVLLSSPERAIIECLYLAPQYISLEHVKLLMESLRTLRPELCQELLERCVSVKVKRLFLYLAELSNHSWLKFIDRNKINLGSGTRQIAKNGQYIAAYKLAIPDLGGHEGYGKF